MFTEGKCQNVDDLKARIITTIASVDADMLVRSWYRIHYHLDIFHAMNSTYGKFTDKAHIKLFESI